MIAHKQEASVYHSKLYGGCDGLTSKYTYPHGKSIFWYKLSIIDNYATSSPIYHLGQAVKLP
jgi:hypothetical protein